MPGENRFMVDEQKAEKERLRKLEESRVESIAKKE